MTWKSWGEEHKKMTKKLHHIHPSKRERHKLIPLKRTYNYNFKSSNEKKRQCITYIQAGTKTPLDDLDSSASQTYKHAQVQSIPKKTYKYFQTFNALDDCCCIPNLMKSQLCMMDIQTNTYQIKKKITHQIKKKLIHPSKQAQKNFYKIKQRS